VSNSKKNIGIGGGEEGGGGGGVKLNPQKITGIQLRPPHDAAI